MKGRDFPMKQYHYLLCSLICGGGAGDQQQLVHTDTPLMATASTAEAANSTSKCASLPIFVWLYQLLRLSRCSPRMRTTANHKAKEFYSLHHHLLALKPFISFSRVYLPISLELCRCRQRFGCFTKQVNVRKDYPNGKCYWCWWRDESAVQHATLWNWRVYIATKWVIIWHAQPVASWVLLGLFDCNIS